MLCSELMPIMLGGRPNKARLESETCVVSLKNSDHYRNISSYEL